MSLRARYLLPALLLGWSVACSAPPSGIGCEPTIARMVPPEAVRGHVLGGIQRQGDAPTASVDPRIWASDKNYLGNETLWLALPRDGVVRGTSVSLTMYEFAPGRVEVSARRIDGPAAEAIRTERDENPGGGPRDRAITIFFPGPGCWEVTYSHAGRELRFVVKVEGRG